MLYVFDKSQDRTWTPTGDPRSTVPRTRQAARDAADAPPRGDPYRDVDSVQAGVEADRAVERQNEMAALADGTHPRRRAVADVAEGKPQRTLTPEQAEMVRYADGTAGDVDADVQKEMIEDAGG